MNKITKIFNNVGFYCYLYEDAFFPKETIKSYQGLPSEFDYFIPYLVRNLKDNYKWEIGIGKITFRLSSGGTPDIPTGICVSRVEVNSSSNNNEPVNFVGDDNEFYLFVNNTNFNSSFNNVILVDDHFDIDSITSIYIVDNNEKTIEATLPEASNSRNIVIDIKALSSVHNVQIRNSSGEILKSTNDSTRLVSDGQSWYILNSVDAILNLSNNKSNELSSQNSAIYMLPEGDEYSFQYKDGSRFSGSSLYWSSGDSSKLLLGSNSEDHANTIIPTLGNDDTIFNKNLTGGDFKIYGSGLARRNFIFTYDGRLGLNIPSGYRPQTIFHVVNNSCREILRLENLSSCHPAQITLYNNPTISSIKNQNLIGGINIAGIDTLGRQRDYVSLSGISENVTSGNGGFILSVSSGVSQVPLISGNVNNINLGRNSSNININSQNINISGSSVSIRNANSSISFNNNSNSILFNSSSLDLEAGTLNCSGPANFNNRVSSNDIRIPNIANSSGLLTVNSQGTIIPANGITFDSLKNSIKINSIKPNQILSVDSNSTIVGLYNLNDYFLTEKDIIWNKFSPRQASVCLRQITFDIPVPIEEFSVGDQIEIKTENSFIYRTIENYVVEESSITELILDQNVTTNSVNNVEVVSITKGGFLLMQKSVDSGVSDSSSNILSIRPFTETVFNTGKKDIDFTIYGTNIKPALKVLANTGSTTRVSGTYHKFATISDSISPILVNSSGVGLSNVFSTANYDYNSTDNLFSGKLSDVGSNGKSSFYGTYDQNGNVAEWLESRVIDGFINIEIAAGGSFNTKKIPLEDEEQEELSQLESAEYLRNINSLVARSGYEDVGFRVASIVNITDAPNVSQVSNLSNNNFVSIRHPNNIPDNSFILTSNAGSSFNENLIPGLGTVDHEYRMTRYEITNNQYVKFLNSVATGISSVVATLYDDRMESSDSGGIIKKSEALKLTYEVKPNMGNKPVNFIRYDNALKYINWLENGAPFNINMSNVNNIINQGAYTIFTSNNNIEILTNKNRKYFLPSLNQWHKSAYFEYQESVVVSGSPVVAINTDTPRVVATERLSDFAIQNNVQPKTLLANLTVSGWLIVDKIIVREHGGRNSPFRSSLADIGFTPAARDTETSTQSASDPIKPPAATDNEGILGDDFWEDPSSQPEAGGVYGEREPPLVISVLPESIDISCEDTDLIEENNLPFWCSTGGKFNGPSYY
jgi:hypothetical protein